MKNEKYKEQFKLIELFVKGVINAQEFIERYSEIDDMDFEEENEDKIWSIFENVEEAIACYEPNELKWKESMKYLNDRQFAVKIRWAYERLKKYF